MPDSTDEDTRLQTRRTYLQLATAGLAAVAGCMTTSQSSETTTESPPTEPPEETTAATTEQPTTTAAPEFKERGVLSVETADGPLGPDGFFDQGQRLEDSPDTHLVLTDKAGEPMTEQDLVETYHYSQLQRTAQKDGAIQDRQTLQQLPHNILSGEWRMNKIHEKISDLSEKEIREGFNGEGNSDEDLQDFIEEKYTSDKSFGTRYTESKLFKIWSNLTHVVLGGPSSTQDYIKADAIAATEYYAAGKETATFSMKTNDGTHGLVFAISNPSYQNPADQETWIVETDPMEETQVVDLDEQESYPTRPQTIFINEVDDVGGTGAWSKIGLQNRVSPSENIEMTFHGGKEFEKFLLDPTEQKGRKYLHSASIAAYINDHATPDGQLPEFQNGHLDIYPSKIEYEVPPPGSPASKLAANFQADFESDIGLEGLYRRNTLQVHVHLVNQTEEVISTEVTIEVTVSGEVVETREEPVSVPVDQPEQLYLDIFPVDELSDSQINSIANGDWQIRYTIADYTVETSRSY